MRGKIRCDSHGGKSLGGLAHPGLTKGGLYSKSLPTRLGTEYDTLLTLGADLFQINDETAAVTTLIQEQLSRVEEGESGAAWKRLKEIYDEMAVIGGNPNKSDADVREFNALFTQIGRVINYGNMQWAARAEAARLMDLKRKFVADERKDMAQKHQVMRYDEIMLLMTALVATFRQALERHVNSEGDRREILNDTQRFFDKVVKQ